MALFIYRRYPISGILSHASYRGFEGLITGPRRKINYTCSNNVKNTRLSLFPDQILAPTHQSSVLKCSGRGEGQEAGRAICPNKTTAHCFGLGRVVEGPSEIKFCQCQFCTLCKHLLSFEFSRARADHVVFLSKQQMSTKYFGARWRPLQNSKALAFFW